MQTTPAHPIVRRRVLSTRLYKRTGWPPTLPLTLPLVSAMHIMVPKGPSPLKVTCETSRTQRGQDGRGYQCHVGSCNASGNKVEIDQQLGTRTGWKGRSVHGSDMSSCLNLKQAIEQASHSIEVIIVLLLIYRHNSKSSRMLASHTRGKGEQLVELRALQG